MLLMLILYRNEIHRGTGVKSKLSYRAEQRGLRWYGQMERMNDRRMTKRVMNSKAEGITKRGWKEGISNSLRTKGSYPWRKAELSHV